MTLKNTLVKSIVYFVEILLFYSLEQTSVLGISYLMLKPIFLISIAVCIALFESQAMSLGFAVVCGLMMDVGAGTFGFNTIMLSIICYCIGILAIDLIKTNLLTATICTTISVLVVIILQFLFFYIMKGYSDVGYAFIYHCLPTILLSIIPIPLIYFLNKLLFLTFNN